ncbi:alpha/beta hydrolase family protein [Saccharothrix variisporea]|uniref:alpha/beta hydrolase family protein n=1 Tax=Saccharothrix variisporea TaxID=543527 RepID=UPI001FEC345D|nr:alpha/beta hydrolase [Saccharothrix variisporea]
MWIDEDTAVGPLRARVRHDPDRLLPGLVFVDGSGNSAVEDMTRWADRISGCGAAVLWHDKPGCGTSPGNWRDQSLADRAAEALAAVDVLRGRPGVDPDRVGLIGWSQGGWVSLLAAATAPVAHVVTVSGPGVSMAAQERWRIQRSVEAAGLPVAEAMAWVDERTRRLRAGDPVEDVLRDQERLRDQPWYPQVSLVYDLPERVSFFVRNMDLDPADLLPRVRCPLLALFGGADDLVPVPESVAVFAPHATGLAVFPGADHDLAVPGGDPLAAGFAPVLSAFLGAGTGPAPSPAPARTSPPA